MRAMTELCDGLHLRLTERGVRALVGARESNTGTLYVAIFNKSDRDKVPMVYRHETGTYRVYILEGSHD